MKHKVGDVVYLTQHEFEGSATDPEYIFFSDAILIINKIDKGDKHNYYVCDLYICEKRRWEEEQMFLASTFDDDFKPLEDPTYFKEAIESTFEGWR